MHITANVTDWWDNSSTKRITFCTPRDVERVYNRALVHSSSEIFSWDLTKLANTYLPIILLSFIASDDCLAWEDHKKNGFLFVLVSSLVLSMWILTKAKAWLCGLKCLCLSSYNCLICCHRNEWTLHLPI